MERNTVVLDLDRYNSLQEKEKLWNEVIKDNGIVQEYSISFDHKIYNTYKILTKDEAIKELTNQAKRQEDELKNLRVRLKEQVEKCNLESRNSYQLCTDKKELLDKIMYSSIFELIRYRRKLNKAQ